jgi:hypothetical protein
LYFPCQVSMRVEKDEIRARDRSVSSITVEL